MEQFILIFHFVVAVALIGLILIQQGKGAEAGASFGAGASQTVLGSSGGWNFFSKTTAILATVFFVTSVSLAIAAKNRTVVDTVLLPELREVPAETTSESSIPELEPEADTDLPAVDDSVIPVQD
ncbi:MAG: preprotein translocase subunit SecG [Porticoccaceae bacterium]|nr:preprotein translocase subunit SecG [Porticoccaceae bacterium]